ncbi:MAG: hypothetical protein ACFHWX_12000 [Bacteroidota bacterium]
MIEDDNLKYLINEEIILVKEDRTNIEEAKVVEINPESPKSPLKTHDVMVWTHELTQSDQELLEKMLKAVKLDLKKVHLIHHEDQYTNHFNTLLSFGNVDFVTDKVNTEVFLNRPFQFERKSILVSYPISSLHEDVKKKTELWNALKELFHI